MLLQLVSLVLLPVAVSFYQYGPSMCPRVCPPHVIHLPRLPTGICEFIAPCPRPKCPCRRKREVNRVPETVGSDDRNCNNDQLVDVIQNGIKKNLNQAKSIIHSEARSKLGGKWVVMCAPEPVSLVTQSRQYCLAEQNGTWCYAFQIKQQHI